MMNNDDVLVLNAGVSDVLEEEEAININVSVGDDPAMLAPDTTPPQSHSRPSGVNDNDMDQNENSSSPSAAATLAAAVDATVAMNGDEEETPHNHISLDHQQDDIYQTTNNDEQESARLSALVTAPTPMLDHSLLNDMRFLFKNTRYFLLKSNNYENVRLAKQLGVWATPKINQIRLNKAFRECANVMVIFSVSESGRFQGYARLSSECDFNTGLQVNWVMPPMLRPGAFAGLFRIDWITKADLVFQKTAHLQNPWNEMRNVKVGRDGQEFEPECGEQLCRLFDLCEKGSDSPEEFASGAGYERLSGDDVKENLSRIIDKSKKRHIELMREAQRREARRQRHKERRQQQRRSKSRSSRSKSRSRSRSRSKSKSKSAEGSRSRSKSSSRSEKSSEGEEKNEEITLEDLAKASELMRPTQAIVIDETESHNYKSNNRRINGEHYSASSTASTYNNTRNTYNNNNYNNAINNTNRSNTNNYDRRRNEDHNPNYNHNPHRPGYPNNYHPQQQQQQQHPQQQQQYPHHHPQHYPHNSQPNNFNYPSGGPGYSRPIGGNGSNNFGNYQMMNPTSAAYNPAFGYNQATGAAPLPMNNPQMPSVNPYLMSGANPNMGYMAPGAAGVNAAPSYGAQIPTSSVDTGAKKRHDQKYIPSKDVILKSTYEEYLANFMNNPDQSYQANAAAAAAGAPPGMGATPGYGYGGQYQQQAYPYNNGFPPQPNNYHSYQASKYDQDVEAFLRRTALGPKSHGGGGGHEDSHHHHHHEAAAASKSSRHENGKASSPSESSRHRRHNYSDRDRDRERDRDRDRDRERDRDRDRRDKDRDRDRDDHHHSNRRKNKNGTSRSRSRSHHGSSRSRSKSGERSSKTSSKHKSSKSSKDRK